jgi:N6-adenosine-specific RNA methylase IME4
MAFKLNGGFGVIYSDPAWPYDNNQDHNPARGGTPYPQMSIEDLIGMRPLIDKVAAKDSLLFQWCTFPKLLQGFEVMQAWGYEPITVAFTWIKLNPTGKVIVPKTTFDTPEGFKISPKDLILKGGIRSGQGYYTNANAEIVLLGKRGKTSNLRAAKDVKQVVFSEGETIITPIGAHSAKPEEVRKRIEELTGYIPGLELFARPPARVPGWIKLGGEIDNEDIRVMLQRLVDGTYRRPKDG